MKKSYSNSFEIPLILFAILIASLWQIRWHKNIQLEPMVEWEVREVLAHVDSSSHYYWPDQYPNNLYLRILQHDTVGFNTFAEPIRRPFSACWQIEEDVISILGSYGENPNGFNVKIINKQAKAYYINSFQVYDHWYSQTPNGPLIKLGRVESEKTKLILNDMPSKDNKDTLFGFVELETAPIYWLAEPSPLDSTREKIEIKMKCYFKAGQCEEKAR
ncbi:MAG: hypothetical protein AAF927_11035 [Bacteroidota bacterium]